MRDLVLAKEFQNSNITFASQDLAGNINNKILESGYKLEILKSNNLSELIDFVKKLKIDMLIIDHYGIDFEFEKSLKERTNVKIFVLDDTYQPHFCDILLNHNISADRNRYINLVPKECEVRCGAEYTLLRDEFRIEKRNGRKLNKNQKSIFLGIGGSDHLNINIDILKILSEFQNIKIDLVTTTANANLNDLKNYVDGKNYIDLHINSNKIASLMNRSHFAIVPPSVLLNEIFYLQVPFIAIKTAENQIDIYEYLLKNGFTVLEKFDRNRLREEIGKFI